MTQIELFERVARAVGNWSALVRYHQLSGCVDSSYYRGNRDANAATLRLMLDGASKNKRRQAGQFIKAGFESMRQMDRRIA